MFVLLNKHHQTQMGTRNVNFFSFLSALLLLYSFNPPQYCTAMDTLSASKKLSVGETLTSAGQIFEFGFFSPGNSGKRYVGIWYKNISIRKVVWVANREKPLTLADSSASLMIGNGGNLMLVDGNQGNIMWSTNSSFSVNDSVAVLLDKGDLVLRNGITGEILWESFNHPCDTFLPGMMIGLNTRTGEKQFLSSWQTEDDPSPGKFVAGVAPEIPLQSFVWNVTAPFWRSGPWDGLKFVGVPDMISAYLDSGFGVVQDNQQGNRYLTFNLLNSSYVRIMTITSTGYLKLIAWDEGLKQWTDFWEAQKSTCDIYGMCGPFGVCSKNGSPICKCLIGFVPNSNEEWSKGNWTNGCVRQTELLCNNNRSNSSTRSGKDDGFLKLTGMKLPDRYMYVNNDKTEGCELQCLNDCSCLAYADVSAIGCMTWAGSVLDIQEFSFGGEDLFLRLAYSELGKGKQMEKLIIGFTVTFGMVFVGGIIWGMCYWRKATQRGQSRKQGKQKRKIKDFGLADALNTSRDTHNQVKQELPVFDLEKIVAATNNFSLNNKLGQGGFGPVFKGSLPDGQEIAVKRLSRFSGQGIEEFENEIILISKLQHRNLVRLLGCCTEGEEMLIVYEYMPNKSLDTFLFDATKRGQLHWSKRFTIIQGIARGLLYLHRDSCLKIIHRDLKVSNILLDKDMNPKISDFGLARIFRCTQELGNTHRVVGTFGYMSPEYAMGGIFSEKSDIFSFGILLLEIVCGRKNTSFQYHEHENLLGYAWHSWNEGSALEFMDQTLVDSCSLPEVIRCIHIGLLCVQDHAADRPAMSAIVPMLSSEMDSPLPKQPTFTYQSLLGSNLRSQNNDIGSVNEVTVSMIEGR